jgi:hypothetical protein
MFSTKQPRSDLDPAIGLINGTIAAVILWGVIAAIVGLVLSVGVVLV